MESLVIIAPLIIHSQIILQEYMQNHEWNIILKQMQSFQRVENTGMHSGALGMSQSHTQ